MKKLVAMLLALALLALTCAAIGESVSGDAAQSEQAANAFDEYDRNGYTHGSVSISGDGTTFVLQVYFNSADKTDCVLAEAVLTDEEVTELEALDFFDDQYWEKQWQIVISLPADRITVTSLNDRIPTEEEISRYAGKTVEELMDDGYEWYTDDEDENGNTVMIFLGDDTGIMYAVTLAGDPSIEDLSDEMIGEQTVETIRFWGIGG